MSRCPSKTRFVLRLVLQSITEATTELTAAVQDPTLPLARQALEPHAAAAQPQGHFDERHDLVDSSPLVVPAIAVSQPEPMLEKFDPD